ncbi:hypothetical protein D3C73_1440310 [compost metagenome]
MMGVDPARIHHRMARVDHPLTGLRFKACGHFGDTPVDDADVHGAGPGPWATQAGHHRRRVLDQDVLQLSHGRLQSEAVGGGFAGGGIRHADTVEGGVEQHRHQAGDDHAAVQERLRPLG